MILRVAFAPVASASLLAAAFFPAGSIAQETARDIDPDVPFVDYPAPFAGYLERLHETGPLAFRDDYPGGHAAWRKAARAKLAELLGLDRIAEQAGDHQPRLVLEGDPIPADGFTRQRGSIETEPGVVIPFWLLRPAATDSDGDGDTSPRPLVICSHGHHASGWNLYAGVYANDEEREATTAKDGDAGVQAVRRGYIALVPATRGLAEVAALPDPKKRHGGRKCRAQLARG